LEIEELRIENWESCSRLLQFPNLQFRPLFVFFLACSSDPVRLAAVRELAPEYGRDEFFLPVDASGETLYPDAGTLAEARDLLARYPEAERWWRVAEGSPSVLLFARWLCHLTGIRHRTVQLFIDHPTLPGLTLVQVRSLDKIEAPGAFDMPVAGHVSGTESVEAALAHELAEELGLDREDLLELRHAGSYEALAPPLRGRETDSRPWRNLEWRIVYRARLRPGALERIRFADGEVAALAVFAVDELRALVTAMPERVASGLTGSLHLYVG
jgi:isopentenyldiphosphate isomerase